MARFALATLIPVGLLAMAAVSGGSWAWGALAYITLVVATMDRLTAFERDAGEDDTALAAARALSIGLALAHFVLLALAVWSLGTSRHGPGEAVAIFVAFGLFFGQVSNSNAHELIHATDRLRRRLGRWVYVSLLFGHHTSAHPLVHHVHVATDDDPNSARSGESYYRFLPRAWIGSFRAGWRAETDRRNRSRGDAGRHPYVDYIAGGMGCLVLSGVLAGWGGVVFHLALAFHAQSQLMLSDYVQHYGLRRRKLADGRLEPVAARHSWNAPQWYSSAMMLNAPRHSDHHAKPSRPYPALSIDRDTMPMLPHSLPVMGVLALWPRGWRRVMDPRVAAWQVGAKARDAASGGGAARGDLTG